MFNASEAVPLLLAALAGRDGPPTSASDGERVAEETERGQAAAPQQQLSRRQGTAEEVLTGLMETIRRHNKGPGAAAARRGPALPSAADLHTSSFMQAGELLLRGLARDLAWSQPWSLPLTHLHALLCNDPLPLAVVSCLPVWLPLGAPTAPLAHSSLFLRSAFSGPAAA